MLTFNAFQIIQENEVYQNLTLESAHIFMIMISWANNKTNILDMSYNLYVSQNGKKMGRNKYYNAIKELIDKKCIELQYKGNSFGTKTSSCYKIILDCLVKNINNNETIKKVEEVKPETIIEEKQEMDKKIKYIKEVLPNFENSEEAIIWLERNQHTFDLFNKETFEEYKKLLAFYKE